MRRILSACVISFCAASAFALSEVCAFQRPACLILDAVVGLGSCCDDSFQIGEVFYNAGADASLHFNRGRLGAFGTVHGLSLGVSAFGDPVTDWMPRDLMMTAAYRIGWNGRGTGWYYASSGRSELTEWGQNYLEIGALYDRVYEYLPQSDRFDYRYSGWGAFFGGGNYALSGSNVFTCHAGTTWNIRFAVWKLPARTYFPTRSPYYGIDDSGWRLGVWIDLGFSFV